MATGAGGESSYCAAQLSQRHTGARDRVRDSGRHRAAHRLHAAVARSDRCRARRRRRARPGTDANGTHHSLWLWRRRAVGTPCRERTACDRGPGRVRVACSSRDQGQGPHHHRGVHGATGAAHPVHHQPFSFASAAAAAHRCRRRHRGNRADVEQLVRELHLRWALARRGQAITDHVEGSHLRADRRHRRCADDLAAGEHRWRAQLGLSVLLAARRDVYAVRAVARRLSRRGAGVAGVAAARGRRQAPGSADHLWHRRRKAVDGARAGMAAGLRRFCAGTYRQCGCRAMPARCLR